jgi:hypothetical protein
MPQLTTTLEQSPGPVGSSLCLGIQRPYSIPEAPSGTAKSERS